LKNPGRKTRVEGDYRFQILEVGKKSSNGIRWQPYQTRKSGSRVSPLILRYLNKFHDSEPTMKSSTYVTSPVEQRILAYRQEGNRR
jgi:hypothetical protein